MRSFYTAEVSEATVHVLLVTVDELCMPLSESDEQPGRRSAFLKCRA